MPKPILNKAKVVVKIRLLMGRGDRANGRRAAGQCRRPESRELSAPAKILMRSHSPIKNTRKQKSKRRKCGKNSFRVVSYAVSRRQSVSPQMIVPKTARSI